ncbi:MAG: phosphoadenosine phosphosulfate reductase, partial [Deltaproteobacteria bacterium]
SSPYGYAPEMLQASKRAFVLYDPESRLDAVHASLFAAKHVSTVALRGLGPNLETELLTMGILPRLLGVAAAGSLTSAVVSKLYRRRRTHSKWLNHLAHRLTHRNRPWLTAVACRSILRRHPSNKLERLYDQSVGLLSRQGRNLPPVHQAQTSKR